MWQARQSAPSYQTDQQPQAQAQSQQQQQNSAPIWQKYDKGEKIGEGTYGWVYHARNKETGKRVALKQFKAGRDGDGLSHTAIREIMLLRELNHENVVRLDSVHIHRAEPCLWLAFDYAEHDLYEMIKFHRDHRENQRVNPTGLMPHHVIKSVMWQLLNGLSYMHQNWVIHRDLKPSNVLVMAGDEGVPAAERGSVRIADFGLARFFQLPLRPLSDNGVVVTIWYRAPELLLGSRHYTRAVDVWAAGCILAELCALRPLFQGQERKQPGNAFQGDQLDRVFRVLGHPNTKCWPDLHALPHWHDNTDNVRVKKPEYPSPPAWAAGSGPQAAGGGSSTAAGGGGTGAHQQPQQQQQAPHHGSSAAGSSAAHNSAQQQQAQQQHSPAPGAGATAATPASNASAAAGGKAEGYVAWAASQLEAAVLDAMRSSLPLWARGRVPEECRPPPEAFHLLALMLDYNPNTRITAEQALAHPYFTRCTPLPTPNVFCAPGSKEPTIRYTTRTVGASAHQGGAHGHDGAGGGGAHPPSSQQPAAGGGRPPAGAAGMHGSRFGGVGPPPAGRVSASAAAAAAAALGNPHAGASRKRKGEPLPGFR